VEDSEAWNRLRILLKTPLIPEQASYEKISENLLRNLLKTGLHPAQDTARVD
jgi:hypothetical protein